MAEKLIPWQDRENSHNVKNITTFSDHYKSGNRLYLKVQQACFISWIFKNIYLPSPSQWQLTLCLPLSEILFHVLPLQVDELFLSLIVALLLIEIPGNFPCCLLRVSVIILIWLQEGWAKLLSFTSFFLIPVCSEHLLLFALFRCLFFF